VQPASKIRELEQWLALKPDDPKSIRQLVTLLEFAPEARAGLGTFSAAQDAIEGVVGSGWQADLLPPDRFIEIFDAWLAVLQTNGVRHGVPIGQVFSGRVFKVKDQPVHCGAWLQFFKETGVIPALCNDCFKVQILPHDLRAMFQTYFLLLNLDLPKDNARKCMIELREGIKFPYKAYVYCDTVEDAELCLQAFRDLQAANGASNVSSKISHGCSEYGQKYPEFKFPENGTFPGFSPKPEWSVIEKDYFRSIRLPVPKRSSNTRSKPSLRDVLTFCTWVEYAVAIGDPTSGHYCAVPRPKLPQQFVQRLREQAGVRADELRQLRESCS